MSQPISNEPLGTPEPTLASTASTPRKKRGIDVYTVMLVSSFVALGIGCLLLYLELKRFQ